MTGAWFGSPFLYRRIATCEQHWCSYYHATGQVSLKCEAHFQRLQIWQKRMDADDGRQYITAVLYKDWKPATNLSNRLKCVFPLSFSFGCWFAGVLLCWCNGNLCDVYSNIETTWWLHIDYANPTSSGVHSWKWQSTAWWYDWWFNMLTIVSTTWRQHIINWNNIGSWNFTNWPNLQ